MLKSNPVLTLLSILCWSVAAFGQTSIGELHIKVVDPSGLGVKTSVQISNEDSEAPDFTPRPVDPGPGKHAAGLAL